MEELSTVNENKTRSWLWLTFELWCWRRLLRVPWITRKSNQSFLNKINLECSLEGFMVKLQYFGNLMPRSDSLRKTLMLGKIEDKRRRGWQRMRWLDSITDSMDMNSRRQWRTEEPGVLQSMGSQRAGRDVVTEQQPHLSCHVYSPFPGPGEKDGSTQSLKC